MSLEVQMMIRDQMNETRQQLVDLNAWEDEMQRRDDELIALALAGNISYKAPTPRGVVDTKSKKVPIAETSKPARAGGDWKETASFGVPKTTPGTAPRSATDWEELAKALKKAEEQEESDAGPPKETAEDHKEKGNLYYKKKNYEAAIREYSRAIEMEPGNATYWFNRATASFQLARYSEGERDATKAISLDPRYAKALVRRGLCRKALGKLSEALQDMEMAQKIDAGFETLAAEMAEIRKKLGISPGGHITEMPEPKRVIIEEPAKPRRGPRVEEVGEVSFAPRRSAAKAEETAPPAPRPKVQVIEVSDASVPGKVSVVDAGEAAAPAGKVTIVDAGEAAAPAGKVTIVDAGEAAAPAGKVTIVDAGEAAAPAGKVTIVDAGEAAAPAGKVTIVDAGEAAPAGDGAAAQALPVGGAGVEVPKVTMGDVGEVVGEGASAEGAAAASRPPKPKPGAKVAPKPKKWRPAFSWRDAEESEYEARLREVGPAHVAESLGVDFDAIIVVRILKALSHWKNQSEALDFLVALDRHPGLLDVFTADELAMVVPVVLTILLPVKGRQADVADARKFWGIDE